LTDTRSEAISRQIRGLLHEPRPGDQHLGRNPLASELTGPMRRDYRLRRFLQLAATTGPKHRLNDRA
jgi:hypothetical protein